MVQDLYRYFRPEAREIIDQFSRGVLDLEKGDGAAAVQRLLRLAHTLKGAARVVKQVDIANCAHAIEDTLSPLREAAGSVGRKDIETVLQYVDTINDKLASLAPGAADDPHRAARSEAGDAPRTIRADVAEADAVLDGVAEAYALMTDLRTAVQAVEQTTHCAALLAAQLAPLATDGDRRSNLHSSQRFAIAQDLLRNMNSVERSLGSTVDQMDRELRQLREAAERLRLVPVGSLFTTLERAAQDAAATLSKRVMFNAKGGAIRIDLHVLETLQGALVQIVRNAVAHGIESESERAQAGKAATGSVSVAVFRRDRRIVFSCSDDGRGVDLEAVRKIASQRGLLNAAKGSDPENLVRLLLSGGISTSKTITEVSGRGIGLDVVREAVGRLGGNVDFRSTSGSGTTFDLVIPPSLASLDALIVEAGAAGTLMAIPLDAVRSTRRINVDEMSFGASGASVLHDEMAVPFVPLSAALDGTPWSVRPTWPVVFVAGTEGTLALGVERLRGAAKVVVRPLPQRMTANPIVVAASLDAEGNPQLVLDPDGLVAAARRSHVASSGDDSPQRPVLVVDDSLTTRMLEQSILESAGYTVDVADSGEQALERVRAKRYALILVDVEMPGMDGFTFIERIRSDAKLRDIPAVLVTSLAEPQHRQRGTKVGAQGYIVKSEFNQAELLAMIEPLMA